MSRKTNSGKYFKRWNKTIKGEIKMEKVWLMDNQSLLRDVADNIQPLSRENSHKIIRAGPPAPIYKKWRQK